MYRSYKVLIFKKCIIKILSYLNQTVKFRSFDTIYTRNEGDKISFYNKVQCIFFPSIVSDCLSLGRVTNSSSTFLKSHLFFLIFWQHPLFGKSEKFCEYTLISHFLFQSAQLFSYFLGWYVFPFVIYFNYNWTMRMPLKTREQILVSLLFKNLVLI